MNGRWSLHLFDWARYKGLEPRLREAASTDNFGHLNDAGADDLLDQMDESATPQEVCNALLLHLCIFAESTTFDTGLPELILWLRRQDGTEDAADGLGALLLKGPNVEEWFACDTGLVGILTHDEVMTLDRKLDCYRGNRKPAKMPRGIGALTRLFTTTDAAKEHVGDLLEIVQEAANRGMGLAAVLED